MVWQVGVLLVGIGFLLLSLFGSFILLNMTRSLRTIEAILTLTLDEARLALPELRHVPFRFEPQGSKIIYVEAEQ